MGYVAGQGPLYRHELRPNRPRDLLTWIVRGYAAERDAQPDHAIEEGRNADRSANVVAVGDRPDAGGYGCPGAAAGTTGRNGWIARGQRASVQRVSAKMRIENAAVLVPPMMMAPARLRLATACLSSVAVASRNATTPLSVGHPA